MKPRAFIETRRRRPGFRLVLSTDALTVTGCWRVKKFDVIQDWRRIRRGLGLTMLLE